MRTADRAGSDCESRSRAHASAGLFAGLLLLGCPESAPPPEHHSIELPSHGTLTVDIEMVDTWEKVYRSVFHFLPSDGGAAEAVIERHWSRALPRVVSGELEPELHFAKQNHEMLAILTRDLVLLRLPQQRFGSESLLVRAGPGDWRRYDFDDGALQEIPAWRAELHPYDAHHGGFSELLHIDVPRLEFTFYRHGGFVVQELTFRLTPDGRDIELAKLSRAPLESRNLGRFDPAWESGALLERAREIFQAKTQLPGWRLDDARIAELYDCPDNGPADRLRVLFMQRRSDATPAAPQASVYRTELWRFERVDGEWRFAEAELEDPPSSAILDLGGETYEEVRQCMKVY